MSSKKTPRQLQPLTESQAQKKRTMLTLALIVLAILIFAGFSLLEAQEKNRDVKRLEAKAKQIITAFADKDYGRIYDEYAEQSFRDKATREKFFAVFENADEQTNRCFGYFKDNFVVMNKADELDGGVKISFKASIEKKTETGSEKEDCDIALYLRKQSNGEYLLYEPATKN